MTKYLFNPTKKYSGISGYYDRRRDAADHYRKMLGLAKQNGEPYCVLDKLRSLLEAAEYTGD